MTKRTILIGKHLWTFVVIAVAAACFSVSLAYLTRHATAAKREIVVNTLTTVSVVTWYTSMPSSDAASIANAFTTETGIGVDIVRDSTFTIRDRIMKEIADGGTKADVVTVADVGTIIELKDRGLLLKYDSPHYIKYADRYKDSGYWAAFAGFGICMAYDETRVKDPPQHWSDLLDPRWKGRIGLEDINTAGSQYGQYYMLRETLGRDFWQKLLSTQEPRIYYKTTDLADALLRGDIDIAAEFSTNTVYSYGVEKGVPIRGIYPSEGIPFVVNVVAILRYAEKPEEAKIFLNFLLSRRGQQVMQSSNHKYSLQDDVEAIQGIPALDDLNILLPDNATDYLMKRHDYLEEFNNFLAQQQ